MAFPAVPPAPPPRRVLWDVVDIVLVSFLIYELLLLIRGTRAVQMALSAGFLIGLFFVSRWFDLETVNWVIRNLATYVASPSSSSSRPTSGERSRTLAAHRSYILRARDERRRND